MRFSLTNLIEFLKEVIKCFGEGDAIDVVYMDFSKAFHEVLHERLVQKVRAPWPQG